jgi:hypothetical protein
MLKEYHLVLIKLLSNIYFSLFKMKCIYSKYNIIYISYKFKTNPKNKLFPVKFYECNTNKFIQYNRGKFFDKVILIFFEIQQIKSKYKF